VNLKFGEVYNRKIQGFKRRKRLFKIKRREPRADLGSIGFGRDR